MHFADTPGFNPERYVSAAFSMEWYRKGKRKAEIKQKMPHVYQLRRYHQIFPVYCKHKMVKRKTKNPEVDVNRKMQRAIKLMRNRMGSLQEIFMAFKGSMIDATFIVSIPPLYSELQAQVDKYLMGFPTSLSGLFRTTSPETLTEFSNDMVSEARRLERLGVRQELIELVKKEGVTWRA